MPDVFKNLIQVTNIYDTASTQLYAHLVDLFSIQAS